MKAAKSQFSNVPYTTGLMLRAPLRAPFSTNILLKYCTTCFIAAFEHKKKKQTASGLLLKSYMIWISPSVHLLKKKQKTQKQTRRISSYRNAETFYVSNTHKEKNCNNLHFRTAFSICNLKCMILYELYKLF